MTLRPLKEPKARARAVELAILVAGGCTLQEVGDAVGLTRERVRQLVRPILGPRTLGWRRVSLVGLEIPRGSAEAQLRRTLGLNRALVIQRRAERRAEIIAALQRIFARTHRPPKLTELAADLGVVGQFPASRIHQIMRTAFAGESHINAISVKDARAAAYAAAGVPYPKRGRDYGFTTANGAARRKLRTS